MSGIWPPYYAQQRMMNPMGYPAAGYQVQVNGKMDYYNAVEEYEKTLEEEKVQRRKIIVGCVVLIVVVLIGRKIIKQDILS